MGGLTTEAQEAMLALCLQHPEAFRRAYLELTPEHFEGQHRNLWGAMQQVGEPLELPLLIDQLSRDEKSRQTVSARVNALRFYQVAKTAAGQLIETLDNAYRHRTLIASLQRSLTEVQHSQADYAVIAAKVEKDLLAATRAPGHGAFISATDALASAYIKAQRAAENGGFSGYKTGLKALDDVVGGFAFGHVTTVMGEPGVGKTALMLQSAFTTARKAPVAIASLEMAADDLMQRLQSALSGVNYRRIQGGILVPDEQERVDKATATLDVLQFKFAPPTTQTFDECIAFFRTMYFEQGCRLFYLDNILSLDYEGQTEYDHVTKVANGSQRFVHELDVALVNLHHTNTNERPDLRSTHGAKAIARHSSNVLALYQPDPRNSRIEFIELKGRNSGKGNFFMTFEGAFQRFRNATVGV